MINIGNRKCAAHRTREKANDEDFLGTTIQASHPLELHNRANYSFGMFVS